MSTVRCDKCPGYFCFAGSWDKDKAPQNCPMILFPSTFEKARDVSLSEDVKNLNVPAAKVEKEGFCKINNKNAPCYPRIREIVEYAKETGKTHIGLAFCKSVSNEAAAIGSIFDSFGLDVDAVLCKCGGIDKSEVGIPKDVKIRGPDTFEASCNPITQAEILNNLGTEINVLIGLCIGHDMLFTKSSKGLVTTLIVKDKVTGNIPQAALYNVFAKRAYLTG